MPDTVTVEDAHLPLDLLLWRRHGQPGNTSEMLSAGLVANRGLAARGPELPLLASVVIPDLPAAAPARRVVSLFD